MPLMDCRAGRCSGGAAGGAIVACACVIMAMLCSLHCTPRLQCAQNDKPWLGARNGGGGLLGGTPWAFVVSVRTGGVELRKNGELDVNINDAQPARCSTQGRQGECRLVTHV